jgi:nicotinate dehydrogenase subunit B
MDPSALDIGAIFSADDTLLIYREAAALGGSVEPFLLIDASDQIYAFNGHVDLGTGIRTSLAQIVAEELDVNFDRVTMILGDTARTPDQGATIASSTIQISAVPLRAAAAQARQLLLVLAGEHFGVPLERLIVDDGIIRDSTSNLAVSYGKLLRGRRDRILLDLEMPVKPVTDYRVVGKTVSRVDIPAKATGGLIFVHDMRLPGMLHGRVVRPPYAGVDWGDFVGTSLIAVDESSISHIPGIIAVVMRGDFVGIVATREEAAVAAAAALRVEWKPTPVAADLGDLAAALRNNPGQPRRLADDGDVSASIAASGAALPRTYVWPYQMHGSIGPSCAIAEWSDNRLRVWSGTQNPHPLRSDLSRLLDVDQSHIEIVRMEAAGCYGRNCADDVTADAALLAQAVGAPVRVQLSREQEHLWEPKGAAQLMEVNGALGSDGSVLAYDFQTRYPSNGPPNLRHGKWAIGQRFHPIHFPIGGSPSMTCPRSCALPGCVGYQRFPIVLRMKAGLMKRPPWPASIQSITVCDIFGIREALPS